ncbi:MAG: LLM class flavin-dependent oxidoreductase, partial [Dehalococcoidia bacterium]|nr:LLM class flavin-dependent oxidoreductase [Dehalococcoidia bacterium]
YLTILRGALHHGVVAVRGRFLAADVTVPDPPKTPILLGALGRKAFGLAGELADGAVTWLCPLAYVQRVALPALAEGAAEAGRPTPPVVLHAPFIVHDDPDEARAAVRQSVLGGFPRRPYYTAMFVAAGFPEAAEGWSDAMIDAVVIHGDESTVMAGLRAAQESGVGEVLAFPMAAGADRAASFERAWALLAKLAAQ